MQTNSPTLLVVDDNNTVTRYYTRLFSKAGYNVVTAPSVTDAMEKFTENVGLVITDYDMPGDSGLLLAQSIKAKRQVPVILVTAYRVVETPAIDAVVHKPFEGQELLELVKRLLTN